MLLHGFTAIQDQIKEAESFLKEMPDAVYQVVKINEVRSVALTPPAGIALRHCGSRFHCLYCTILFSPPSPQRGRHQSRTLAFRKDRIQNIKKGTKVRTRVLCFAPHRVGRQGIPFLSATNRAAHAFLR